MTAKREPIGRSFDEVRADGVVPKENLPPRFARLPS